MNIHNISKCGLLTCRFSPTPGRSTSASIPCSRKMVGLPIPGPHQNTAEHLRSRGSPDNSSSCGVCTAPAESMTSRFALATYVFLPFTNCTPVATSPRSVLSKITFVACHVMSTSNTRMAIAKVAPGCSIGRGSSGSAHASRSTPGQRRSARLAPGRSSRKHS